VLNVFLNLLLLPVLGTPGASIAASLSYVGNLILIALIFRRLSATQLRPSFVPTKEDFFLMRDIAVHYLPRRASGQG
jgi:Na+-driven multidrug efflux pump